MPRKGKRGVDWFVKKFTVDGKTYQVTAKTPDEAERKAIIRKHELQKGIEEKKLAQNNMTVDEWEFEWVETFKSGVNSRYRNDIKSRYALHISPYIGKMRLTEVRRSHCQRIINELIKEEYSYSLVKNIRNHLSELFEDAVADGLLNSTPAVKLELKGCKDPGERRVITDEERKLILRVAEYSRGGLFVLIMLFTGMRPGEVAALKWDNVDLDNRVIHVKESLKATDEEGDPKSKYGIRNIPIPDPLYNRLTIEKAKADEERRAIKETKPADKKSRRTEAADEAKASGYLCTNKTGGKLKAGTVRDLWLDFAYDMNIAAGCKEFKGQIVGEPFVKELTLYCLRHTYATNLVIGGATAWQIKELMGHSDIRVSEKYVHRTARTYESAKELVEAIYNEKTDKKE